MRNCPLRFVAWFGILVCASVVTAANRPDRSWVTVQRWPDITEGMWQLNSSTGAPPRFKPEVLIKARNSPEGKAYNAGFVACRALGPLDVLGSGYSLKFFYTRGEILIMSDTVSLAVRRVFMDGGQHESLDPSYAGRSFGYWKGGALFVETKSFDQSARISVDTGATPLTALSEQYRLVDANTLEVSFSISDSDLFLEPWRRKNIYHRQISLDLQMTSCIGNNREEPGPNGELQLNLTPPN